METMQNIFQAEIIQTLGWTLLHFVWQGVAIGIALAIVLRLLPLVIRLLPIVIRLLPIAIRLISIVLTRILQFSMSSLSASF